REGFTIHPIAQPRHRSRVNSLAEHHAPCALCFRQLDLSSYHKDEAGRQWRRTDLTGPGVRQGDSGLPWRGVDPTTKGRHWQPPSYFYNKYHQLTGVELAQFPLIERLEMMDRAGLIHWPKKADGIPQGKRFLEDAPGVPLQDVWTDVRPIHNNAPERLGYPTQKPVALLDRIIRSSSKKGNVVFDPFCGCGTTIYAAEKADRQWIGCDIAILSINLVRNILAERYHLVEGVHFKVDGIPVSVEQAQELFKHDPFVFQNWAVERVGGFPMRKKVADRGIDGHLYFEVHDGLRHMVLSVKGGSIRPTDVRDLRGVLEREADADLAGFISLREPSPAMRKEANEAGTYEYRGVSYDRIQ
ncbi:MAG: DNA methyltransferase, partial [Ktedonobacteraceae bacterium]